MKAILLAGGQGRRLRSITGTAATAATTAYT